MPFKKRPSRLTIIKPENIEPITWEILMAAKSGHHRKIRKLAHRDPALVKAEYWYTQPIHFAVREGHLSTVKTLLDLGADSTWIRYGHEDLTVIARDRGYDDIANLLEKDRILHNVTHKSDIHEAVISGDIDRVSQILHKDPNRISLGDNEGWTPLHHAVSLKNYAMARLLCDSGANIDLVQRGGSIDWYRKRGLRPVDIALNNGDNIMVGILLAKGAGYTLDLAVAAHDYSQIQELLKNPKNIEQASGRPLAIAVEADSIKLVRMLLESGIDPNLDEGRDAPKGTALYKAVRRDNYDIVKLLLEAGADPNQYIESSGSPMHQAKNDKMKGLLYRFGGNPKDAADFVLDDNIDALATLVSKQDPEETSKCGCGTIFTYVVCFNKPDMLDLLLARGIRVPQVVTGCRSYLWRNPAMTRQLLESGMDPNLPNWQWVTPLHNIAQVNPMFRKKTTQAQKARQREKASREALVDLFLEFGADINALDEEYQSTPLGWAAREGQEDMIEILLQRGADPMGGEPWATPLSWSQRRGYSKIEKQLRNAGASA